LLLAPLTLPAARCARGPTVAAGSDPVPCFVVSLRLELSRLPVAKRPPQPKATPRTPPLPRGEGGLKLPWK